MCTKIRLGGAEGKKCITAPKFNHSAKRCDSEYNHSHNFVQEHCLAEDRSALGTLIPDMIASDLKAWPTPETLR